MNSHKINRKARFYGPFNNNNQYSIILFYKVDSDFNVSKLPDWMHLI